MATIRHNMESNDTSSKRNCRDGDTVIPESSRKKKLKVMNPEKDVGASKDDNVQHYKNQDGSENLMASSLDIITKKTTLQAENTGVSEGKQNTDRNHQTELSCETKVSDGNVQGDTKKLESRSARRKKLKRQLKQKAKAELEKGSAGLVKNYWKLLTTPICILSSVQEESQTAADCPSPSNQDGFSCPPGNQNDSQVLSSGHKTDEEESDSSEDIVPILVRPGHIRFGRAGGEQEKSLASEAQGTFQWNGTMSKKKGQKWGMNNSKNKNTDINYHARITGSSTEVSHHLVDSKITENGSCGVSDQKVGEDSIDNSASVKTIGNEEKSSGWPLNFESLFPLMRLPKEGDLIAYRLVELSSSWCPELSSYRVGKVLIYDPISLRIILVPVPEYPITRDERKTEEESDMLVDMSPYKEDGSLEIEYSSLLDVRLLKGNEAAPAVVSTPFAETGKKDISLAGTPNTLYRSNSNIDSQKAILVQKNRTSQVTPQKTQKTVWEETGEVPNDTSDIKENGWGNWTPNASTSAWSLRALRSSAIGPTVAILRGKNNHRGKPYNLKYGK
jgi:coilin